MKRKIDPEILKEMRSRRGKWAAYENQDLGHFQVGHIQFLKVGRGCTYKVAPKQMPDTQFGLGWRYIFVGFVNFKTGEIEEVK